MQKPRINKPLLLVCLGFLLLTLTAIPNFKEARARAQVSDAVRDMRHTLEALDAYKRDHGRYPQWSSDPLMNASGTHMPTFRVRDEAGAPLGLTADGKYLPRHFPDFFAPHPGAPFAYWASDDGASCILWSAGPDRKYDLTLKNLPGHTLESLTKLQFSFSNGLNSRGDLIRYAMKNEPPFFPNEAQRFTAWPSR